MYKVKPRLFNGNSSLNEKLVAHWALDDEENNQHYADSLGRIPGILVSPTHETEVIAVSGLHGNATSLDGVDYIKIPSLLDILEMDYNKLISNFFVIKRGSVLGSHYCISSSRSSGSTKGILLSISTTGTFAVEIIDGSGNYVKSETTTVINTGSYDMCGYTWDGTNLKTYINGSEDTNNTSSGVLVSFANTEFHIGHDPSTPGTYLELDAILQQYSIWQKDLILPEAAALYDGGVVLPC